ncbi:hypothetical protein [Vulcanisaeta sp. JCM 14467]|uniref:hypothetical protein n=1 Tax=Vulcanisaeta sp. JCM 14467 TaxID=1295370 RepID=UPI000A490838|nr:hypothetical protein [Vulcanisaeta sp. JCM 14467]
MGHEVTVLTKEPLVEAPREVLRDFTLKRFNAIYLQGWLIHKRQVLVFCAVLSVVDFVR